MNNEKTNSWDEILKNDKYETKELSIKDGDAVLTCQIKMDFKLYIKCEAILMSIKGDGDGQAMSLSMSEVGDKLLTMGWHDGDESIRTKFRNRKVATHRLGKWFLDQMPQEEIEEKKN